jgi:hypothetical protein
MISIYELTEANFIAKDKIKINYYFIYILGGASCFHKKYCTTYENELKQTYENCPKLLL